MIPNKTKYAGERYRVIPGGMGNYGDPPDSPQHHYQVVSGVDRGHGYQNYQSVEYALKAGYVPAEAKKNLIKFLQKNGYRDWLRKNGF